MCERLRRWPTQNRQKKETDFYYDVSLVADPTDKLFLWHQSSKMVLKCSSVTFFTTHAVCTQTQTCIQYLSHAGNIWLPIWVSVSLLACQSHKKYNCQACQHVWILQTVENIPSVIPYEEKGVNRNITSIEEFSRRLTAKENTSLVRPPMRVAFVNKLNFIPKSFRQKRCE